MILPWRDVDGISTSLTGDEGAYLERAGWKATVLEVGAAFGYSTRLLSKEGSYVLSIDPHDQIPGTLKAVRENAPLAIIVVATSQMILPRLHGHFDVAFIDGDHLYDAVVKDLKQASRLAGTILVHDYIEETCPDVGRACRDVLGEPAGLVDTLAIYQ